MLELRLQRRGDMLDVQLGAYTATLPLLDVAVNEMTWQRIFEDAVAYGRDLFDRTFRTEQVRSLLAELPAQERLALVADDPIVAAIPWEYLRDTHGKLLAGRCAFVRGLPPEQRRAAFPFTEALDIVAMPVSPIDEPRTLNTEREWRNLVTAVSTLGADSVLTAQRVRPPTLKQMTRALRRQATSIVHFMGHSGSTGGKAVLAFEDARACTHLIDAADFADALTGSVFLVIMTSCLSAVGATTTFGNIAHALVRRQVPYALGMQYVLPDDAALAGGYSSVVHQLARTRTAPCTAQWKTDHCARSAATGTDLRCHRPASGALLRRSQQRDGASP
jgi:CHAT domain